MCYLCLPCLQYFTLQFPDVSVSQWHSTNNEGTLHCSVSNKDIHYCSRSDDLGQQATMLRHVISDVAAL